MQLLARRVLSVRGFVTTVTKCTLPAVAINGDDRRHIRYHLVEESLPLAPRGRRGAAVRLRPDTDRLDIRLPVAAEYGYIKAGHLCPLCESSWYH